ncbi:hypothetical protein BGP_1064 [Beggiatoa sp. PS]|nr:hypothetical protein BGP_1064 [Beggiatoa sp. PS]
MEHKMQKSYQDAADELQKSVDNVLDVLRNKLANEGLNLDKIPKQPMTVEIVSFLLVKCLVEERLTFDIVENKQQALKEAMEIIKAAVIQYRGTHLVPPTKTSNTLDQKFILDNLEFKIYFGFIKVFLI